MPKTSMSVFFFQAEDGIRDTSVTGVQTCALPISYHFLQIPRRDCPESHRISLHVDQGRTWHISPGRERIRNAAELVRKDEPGRARNRNWNRRPWRIIPAGPATLL